MNGLLITIQSHFNGKEIMRQKNMKLIRKPELHPKIKHNPKLVDFEVNIDNLYLL